MNDTTLPAPAPTGPPKSAMFIVFLVVFIDLLGFGIVLPIMPRLADEYMTGYSKELRGVIIGTLFSSFSVMQFLLSPMWGRMSDRIGRRPILILGLLGSIIFYTLFAFAVSLPKESSVLALCLMLISRIGAGAAGATIGTAAAVIADCTTPEKRAKGMALIGAAFGIGFTFGPLIAYFGLELFEKQQWGVGAIAASLSLVATVLAVLLLPETRKPSGHVQEKEPFSMKRSLNVIKSPIIGPLIVIYFLAIFGFANFEATLAQFTKAAFNMDDRGNFLVFAFVGFVLMVAQGGLYRPLVGRWKEERMMSIGVALMLLGLGALGVVAYGTSHLFQGLAAAVEPMFYIALAIAVTGFAFVNPSISSLISQRADPNRQGEILGVGQSASSLGRILGPFVGSVVFQMHDSHTLPYVVAGLALVGVIMLLPVVSRNSGS